MLIVQEPKYLTLTVNIQADSIGLYFSRCWSCWWISLALLQIIRVYSPSCYSELQRIVDMQNVNKILLLLIVSAVAIALFVLLNNGISSLYSTSLLLRNTSITATNNLHNKNASYNNDDAYQTFTKFDDNISDFSESPPCPTLSSSSPTNDAIQKAIEWKPQKNFLEEFWLDLSGNCSQFKGLFEYPEQPYR